MYIYYKRSNHAESFRIEKINHKNLKKQAVRAVNYFQFIDCRHDAPKQNGEPQHRPP